MLLSGKSVYLALLCLLSDPQTPWMEAGLEQAANCISLALMLVIFISLIDVMLLHSTWPMYTARLA